MVNRLSAIITALCILLPAQASAQYWAWYPNYYGYGYYRAPYYGGGLGPSCGYYGCYVTHRYQYQPHLWYREPVPIRRYQPRHVAAPIRPLYHYDWSWGGGARAYLGDQWGGEW